jgi:sec-independent protein translocase protein TatB
VFDVGFFELLLVGAVALIVLGPERLPHAARLLAGLIRRARASWYALKAEIERELEEEARQRIAEEAKRSSPETAKKGEDERSD